MADKAFQDAIEAEQTGWFKWWPDLALASEKYETAAKLYRECKMYGKAKEAYLRASRIHQQSSA
jgi:hypothetical protein